MISGYYARFWGTCGGVVGDNPEDGSKRAYVVNESTSPPPPSAYSKVERRADSCPLTLP